MYLHDFLMVIQDSTEKTPAYIYCKICGMPIMNCIYCQKEEGDICQTHCLACPHFETYSGCWHCTYKKDDEETAK
nr:MAG TPA: Malignant T-cell-amplified sequence 1, Density-regulated, ribosome, zinc binding, tRNA [Caudoviricetes sp.]